MVGRTSTYRLQGRFFGRRVNCEQVPLLPASTVAEVLGDPRHVPYTLTWETASGEIQEFVQLVPYARADAVEVRRNDGTTVIVHTLLRRLPCNGGSALLLICPRCPTPRRGLYGWRPGGRFTTSTVQAPWACRTCNGLRYSSEGSALACPGRGDFARMFEATFGRNRPARPDPWLPSSFPSRNLHSIAHQSDVDR
jgi:hypothetical protein